VATWTAIAHFGYLLLWVQTSCLAHSLVLLLVNGLNGFFEMFLVCHQPDTVVQKSPNFKLFPWVFVGVFGAMIPWRDLAYLLGVYCVKWQNRRFPLRSCLCHTTTLDMYLYQTSSTQMKQDMDIEITCVSFGSHYSGKNFTRKLKSKCQLYFYLTIFICHHVYRC